MIDLNNLLSSKALIKKSENENAKPCLIAIPKIRIITCNLNNQSTFIFVINYFDGKDTEY